MCMTPAMTPAAIAVRISAPVRQRRNASGAARAIQCSSPAMVKASGWASAWRISGGVGRA